jgi:multisubunit Na+/H+ antiporter MnhF subunit
MIEAALNVTFWLVLGAVLWILARRRRSNGARESMDALGRFLRNRVVLAALGLGALFNAGSAIYLGYEAPRDIMQDIISARLLLSGKPAFPLSMTADIKDALEHEPPPFTLSQWIPALRARERRAYLQVVTSPWVQAHPPAMSLLLIPFVASLSIRHAYLVCSALSLACLLFSVVLLLKNLPIARDNRSQLAFLFAILGWFQLGVMLRLGQTGVLLGFLLTLAWYFLRREKPLAAGVAVSLAVALKLFPAFLFPFLFLRQRRAFWAAVVATAAFLGGTAAVVGRANLAAYAQVTRFVEDYYRGYPGNLSLLSWLVTLTGTLNRHSHVPDVLFFLLMAAIVVALAWVITRPSGADAVLALDLEYAIFVALLPILSPVAWDHYLTLLLLPMMVLATHLAQSEHLNQQQLLLFFCALLTVVTPQPALGLISEHLQRVLPWGTAFLVEKLPTVGVIVMAVMLANLRRGLGIEAGAAQQISG